MHCVTHVLAGSTDSDWTIHSAFSFGYGPLNWLSASSCPKLSLTFNLPLNIHYRLTSTRGETEFKVELQRCYCGEHQIYSAYFGLYTHQSLFTGLTVCMKSWMRSRWMQHIIRKCLRATCIHLPGNSPWDASDYDQERKAKCSLQWLQQTVKVL